MAVVETKEVNGYRVELHYVDACDTGSPIEDECLPKDTSILILGRHSFIEVEIGPETPTLRELSGWEKGDDDEDDAMFGQLYNDNLVLPIYKYEHGNVAYSLSSFSCPWDSGCCGVLSVPMTTIKDEWNGDVEKATTYFQGLFESYSSWCNGEVYGFTVTNLKTGEEVDACWGSIGEPEYCFGEGISSAESMDLPLQDYTLIVCKVSVWRTTAELLHVSAETKAKAKASVKVGKVAFIFEGHLSGEAI